MDDYKFIFIIFVIIACMFLIPIMYTALNDDSENIHATTLLNNPQELPTFNTETCSVSLWKYYDAEEEVMCYFSSKGGLYCIPDSLYVILGKRKR